MDTTWRKIKIQIDDGSVINAQAPEIVSGSRSTDIPAFYADWFFHRLEKGYSAWTNPFNGIKSYISYNNTRFIVFWSKNPRPLLKHLDYLKEKNIGCYIQYSLNDYEKEGLERGVPKLEERIDTFKLLVDRLGFGSVIWRFDPLILTDDIDINKLLNKIEKIGDQLLNYTDKLVFSFADIAIYRKVKTNLEKNRIPYKEWTEVQMLDFAKRLSEMNRTKGWNYDIATCGEKIDIDQFGIRHNHCVDDDLIIRTAYKDNALMNFLGVTITDKLPQNDLFGATPEYIKLDNGQYAIKSKDNKDKGQRVFCGCIKSKDIGEYNTCAHLCEYCYANTNKQIAINNFNHHKNNPWSDTITGR